MFIGGLGSKGRSENYQTMNHTMKKVHSLVAGGHHTLRNFEPYFEVAKKGLNSHYSPYYVKTILCKTQEEKRTKKGGIGVKLQSMVNFFFS